MRPLPAAIEVLGAANASVQTPAGLAAISWRLDVGTGAAGVRLSLNATVPPGSTADIVLPAVLGQKEISRVTEGKIAAPIWSNGKYVAPAAAAGFLGFSHKSVPYEALAFEVGSGSFILTAVLAAA